MHMMWSSSSLVARLLQQGQGLQTGPGPRRERLEELWSRPGKPQRKQKTTCGRRSERLRCTAKTRRHSASHLVAISAGDEAVSPPDSRLHRGPQVKTRRRFAESGRLERLRPALSVSRSVTEPDSSTTVAVADLGDVATGSPPGSPRCRPDRGVQLHAARRDKPRMTSMLLILMRPTPPS